MPRQRDPRRDKAFEIWKQHNGDITNREIAKMLDVDEKVVAVWKQRDKWNVVQQTNTNVVQQNNSDDISWVEIENEYVTDIRKKPCTLEDLSNKYGIAIGTIEKYSMENKWSEKRKKYKETIKRKAVEKTAEIISDDLSQVTARHLRVSDKLISIIEEALEDENELYKYVEKLRQGYGKGAFEESIVVDVKDALNDAKLLNIVQSLEKLQKMQRQTLGILDAKDQHKIEMDKRKMGDDDTEFEDDGFPEALDGKIEEVWDDEEA